MLLRALSIVVAGSFVIVGVGTPAAFGQTPAPKPGQTPNASNTNAGTHAQIIAELKATRALLHKGDHDYQGYRHKAVHQITEAIHALEGVKGVPQKPHKPIGNHTNGHEPQSVSDGQLAQAVQQLQTVQSQLAGNQHHRAVAANKHVSNAIQDLQTALKIK